MPTDALFAAPLLVAAVLVASGVGKLRDPERAGLAFDALDVPPGLARPWMRTAHPWAELLLAVCLLATSGVASAVTAALVTLLFTAYLLLIIRAVQRPEPTDCACFGAAGAEQVSGMTVVRNVWLLVLAGLALWVALDGRSLLQWAAGAGQDAWWLAAVAAAAVTVGLILYPGGSPAARPATEPVVDVDLDDYERTAIPHVPVTLGDGSVISLRDLARARPKLLLAVSTTCGGCVPVIEAAPEWQRRLPEVDLHLLYATDVKALSGAAPVEALYDPKRFVFEALSLAGTPSAVLLGADGMLAGGPVAGHNLISAFVTDIEAELAAARLLSTPN